MTTARVIAAEKGLDGSRSPTAIDVAREVGCSIATVSRALNPIGSMSRSVSGLWRLWRLGYVPNASARALRSAKPRLMGAVIPTLGYPRMIESLQGRLSTAGVSLAPAAVGSDLKLEAPHIRLLLEPGVEGPVLVGAPHRPESFRRCGTEKFPLSRLTRPKGIANESDRGTFGIV